MVVVIVLVVWLISVYNNLVRMRNNRENAFANIDVQLKQRFDLIPQLVASVKGYATHEKEVFLQVTQARTATANAQSIDDKIKADNLLTSALQGLKVTLEAYPELKANQNFLQLQSEISDIENKLAAARRFFNSATREYNNAVETFLAISSQASSSSTERACTKSLSSSAPTWRKHRKLNSKAWNMLEC